MATRAEYNGVVFENTLTSYVDQNGEFDSSGSQWMMTKTTIKIVGTVYKPNSGTAPESVCGIVKLTSMPTWLKEVMDRLSEPRRVFRYSINGQTVWHVDPAIRGQYNAQTGQFANNPNLAENPLQEVKNGPTTNARAIHMTSDKSARIEFTITFHTVNCQNGDKFNSGGFQLQDAVINLHYRQHDDIDQTWYNTRTYTGQLRVSRRDISPMLLRSLVLPPLQAGYERKRISTHETQDGFGVDFTITDRQTFAVAPFPALEWSGNHAIVWSEGASVVESEVSAQFKGPPGVNKQWLAFLATQVIWDKLYYNDQASNESYFLRSVRLHQNLGDTVVGISGRVLHTNPTIMTTKFQEAFNAPINFVDGYGTYNPKKGYFLKDLNHTLEGLFQQAILEGPCDPHSPWSRPLSPSAPAVSTGGGDPTEPGSNGDGLGSYFGQTQTNVVEKTYTHYYVTHDYVRNSGRIVLPLAYSPSSQQSTVTVDMHKPYMKRQVRIEAERLGAWPDTPNFKQFTDSSNKVNVPHVHQPILNNPVVSADGLKVLYSMKFQADYYLQDALGDADNIQAGLSPFIKEGGAAVVHYLGVQNRKDPNSTDYKTIR